MATDVRTHQRIESRPEFAKILRDDERFASGTGGEDVGESINGWFDRLMLQSGTNVSPTGLLLVCVLCAVLFGGLAFVLQGNLLSTAVAALLTSFIPVVVVMIVRSRRQKKLLQQMPGMIGELARAARTGRSLEQCMDVVAADTPAPLGHELQRSSRKMQMGLSVSEAIDDLPDRTGLVSMNVFCLALKVHHQTGGDLVAVLERLAATIRDRLTFLGRLKAATIASRATAILMVAIPPLVLAFFMFRDPEYLNNLLASSWGRFATITAFALQAVGTAWVFRIMRSSQRG